VPRMLSLVVYTCGMHVNLLKPGAKSSATSSTAAGGGWVSIQLHLLRAADVGTVMWLCC
jgi:hypothetical protein